MISPSAVVALGVIVAGLWALGFGIGQSVAWVRRIRDVA